VRALDRDVRALLEQRIKALAPQAESFGVRAEVDWRRAMRAGEHAARKPPSRATWPWSCWAPSASPCRARR
jgi:hypothetical protein